MEISSGIETSKVDATAASDAILDKAWDKGQQ